MTVEELAPVLGGVLLVAGVAVLLSRRRELMLRWCLWAVAVPVVTAAFWLGEPGVTAVAVLVGFVAALEYGGLVGVPPADRVVLALAVVALAVTAWLEPDEVLRVAGVGLLAVAAVPLLQADAERGLRRVALGVLGLVWIGVLAGAVPLGVSALVLFAAVSVGDVVAYVAGPRLGGPRLSPLSPAKRWSGTLAGAAAGLLVLLALSSLTWPLALAVVVGAPAGDLLESMVKRGVGTKDSAGWMAGQGGLLDRIDSFLVALAILLVVG